MSRLIFLLLVICLGLHTSSFACEVCGCSATGSIMTINPDFRSNFVTLGWRYSRFYASENLDGGTDYFHQANLTMGFRPLPRWQILTILPYNLNRHVSVLEDNAFNGLGDGVFMTRFTVAEPSDSSRSGIQQYLFLGAGIKSPTGKFDLNNQETAMPANFQLGSGSWDYLFNLLYNFRYRPWGITLDITTRLNTRNKDEYRFGNQAVARLFASFLFRKKKVSFMPYGGIYTEILARNVHQNIYQYGTGGSGAYATGGMEIQTRTINMNLSYQRAVATHYAGGEITGGDRVSASISYLF